MASGAIFVRSSFSLFSINFNLQKFNHTRNTVTRTHSINNFKRKLTKTILENRKTETFSGEVNADGIKSFLRRCPSIEIFNIHETFRLSNDIIRLIFARLKSFRIYNDFIEEESADRKDRPWRDLTKGCRELQTLRIIDPNNNVDVKYDLFKRIRSLKVIFHAKHDMMTRASCFSIKNYVKAIGIPYSKLGKLQGIIDKYSDDELD